MGLYSGGVGGLSFMTNKNNTLIVVTHYEKLIEGLNPDAVIVLKKDEVVVGDNTLAQTIFSKGLESV